MIKKYQGMRWLKSDLQVQTPEDAKHWHDKDLQLGNPRRLKGNESDIQEKARKFLHRCHELELELIGLTDHNFSERKDPRDWFSVHLLEQNKSVAKKLDRKPLIILPGFEVDIGYHVLCLFAPAKKQSCFEKCNSVLTGLGLQEDKRFESGVPQELRRNDQVLSLKVLLETIQNEHGGIVIAAHSDSNDGIIEKGRKEDFKNEALYCVEITQNPPSQGIKNILEGKDPNWKRTYKQPAFIMSSDAKSIKIDVEGHPIANSLGYRYTWIKMSEPSIESLRQAFLDSSSRIKLPIDTKNDVNPEKLSEKNIIKSISIENVAFLECLELHFSPNLNCIIGGRGSGKSTLLEYLRTAFKKDSAIKDPKTKDKIERVQNTLNSNDTIINVQWQNDQNNEDTILWKKDTGPLIVSREVVNTEKYFSDLPISFYSQQQLNQLSESVVANDGNRQARGLLDLLNSFSKDDLAKLEQQERELKLEIDEANIQYKNLAELKCVHQGLRHDFNELDLKWRARNDIQEDAKLHEVLTAEGNYLKSILSKSKNNRKFFEEKLEEISKKKTKFELKNSPHKKWIESFHTGSELAEKKLIDSINQALEIYTSELMEPFNSEEGAAVKYSLKKTDENFENACKKRGMSVDDVADLSSINYDRNSKLELLTEKETEISKVESKIKNIDELLDTLHQVWAQQYEIRNNMARSKSEKIKEENSKNQNSMIKVTVLEQQDWESFKEHWSGFCPPDKRTRLGQNWIAIGNQLYDNFVLSDGFIEPSPWDLLNNLINHDIETVDFEYEVNIKKELYQYITSNPDGWLRLRYQRVLDSVDVELFRHDGNSAGSISDNNLSDGQRNTAVLALLLSQEGGPLIIDQPEDELDSNFVYKELIPLLRSTKQRRQLIIATHNANLPVNGDAELVYAFDVKDGKGIMKACGGLDNPDVTLAILDIMEGTEEAFRRRREKYNF